MGVICAGLIAASTAIAQTLEELIAAYIAPDILLTWQHPTQRMDGTELLLEEIQGYNVYYTIDGGPEQRIALPRVTSYKLTTTGGGLYSFQVATVAEAEGPRTEAVEVPINGAPPAFPAIKVTLEFCNDAGECTSQELP